MNDHYVTKESLVSLVNRITRDMPFRSDENDPEFDRFGLTKRVLALRLTDDQRGVTWVHFVLAGAHGCAVLNLIVSDLAHVQPNDLGVHALSPIPGRENREFTDCTYLTGGYCFYDGSGIQAHALWETATQLSDGEQVDLVWTRLLDWYDHAFEVTG